MKKQVAVLLMVSLFMASCSMKVDVDTTEVENKENTQVESSVSNDDQSGLTDSVEDETSDENGAEINISGDNIEVTGANGLEVNISGDDVYVNDGNGNEADISGENVNVKSEDGIEVNNSEDGVNITDENGNEIKVGENGVDIDLSDLESFGIK